MAKNMRRLTSNTGDRAKTALRGEAETIMTRSKREFVPVDEGTLRSSGHVQDPVRRGKEVSVTMAYGGAASPYALAVHEHPSKFSPPSWEGKGVTGGVQGRDAQGRFTSGRVTFNPEGRGPKYLERPFRQQQKGMAQRLAAKIRPRDSRGRFVSKK